ncbi:MAG: glutaredoxin 3 [Woeseiaceae bacterium]|nr:glutaredoxin 3 [Woeseiaceae bacterium]
MPDSQPNIVIYGTETCGYCSAARMLLKKKGLDYKDLLVSRDPELRREMEERSGGGRSVPQIFIGDHHVGGYDELYSLEKSGDLDKLLNDGNGGT